MNISKELVKIAKLIVSIDIKETNDEFIVSGQYKDMAPILQKLKSNGFRYNPSDKSWRIPLKKLNNEKRNKLSDFLPMDESAKNILEQKKKEETKNKESVLYNFYNKYKNLKNIEVKMERGNLIIYGDVFDFKDIIWHAGGKYDSSTKSYSFDPEKIDEKELDKVGLLMEKKDDKIEKHNINILKELNELKKHNSNEIKCEIIGNILNIYSSDKKYRDTIKKHFERAKWNGSYWEIPINYIDPNDIKSFISEIDKLNENNIQQISFPKSKYVIQRGSGYGGKPFYEGQIIKNNKDKIDKGEPKYLYVEKALKYHIKEDGLSFGVGDDSGFLYTAYCREAKPEEAQELIREEHDYMNRNSANKRLKEIIFDIKKHGNVPKNADPKGKTYIVEPITLYGGGSWIVINNDDLWFVENNGADGDDWSLNNVSTGGAGAIGWTIKDKELSFELSNLLENSLNIKPKQGL